MKTPTDKTFSGQCQCGTVGYTVIGQPVAAFVCHCKDCQRQSGSAFGMALWIEQAQLHLKTGATSVQDWIRQTPSGHQMRCRFCSTCGSRLFHQVIGSPYLSIKPGSLDDLSELGPTSHLWLQSKQAWVPIPPDAQTFNGNPSDMHALLQAWASVHQGSQHKVKK